MGLGRKDREMDSQLKEYDPQMTQIKYKLDTKFSIICVQFVSLVDKLYSGILVNFFLKKMFGISPFPIGDIIFIKGKPGIQI
jgi:hypothetical protein